MTDDSLTERTTLAGAVEALVGGDLSAADYTAARWDRIDAVEDTVRAWVDGPKPRRVALAEAESLDARYPDAGNRPPLFGVPVGTKDIVHVDGLPTSAGSDLPPGELAGPEATVVRRLREAGAFVAGKTVTTEFAWMAPGPTRNPHAPAHTPGGSSSGSAAAVAAGMVPLAVGSQTIGSVVRPAAFCGVVGFKPTYDRIPRDGVVPLSPSVDHVGLFTGDAAGMATAAGVCLDNWRDATFEAAASTPDRPTLGVPAGPYLDQASAVGRDAFEAQVDALAAAGYGVQRVSPFDDIDAVNARHEDLVAAEAALAHESWFAAHGERYADSTAALLRDGRSVSTGRLARARRSRVELRESLHEAMTDLGVDLWVAPAAPGPAPEGIDDTGDPVMNLPWTHAGLPTVALPAGTVDGLPVGVQCAGRFGRDERVLAWATDLATALPG